MPVVPLPPNPDLDHLRAIAKQVRDWVRAGVEGSLDLVREHHPRSSGLAAGSPEARRFSLADAQLTLARHHGFASWPKMKAHVELARSLSRSPHEQSVGGAPSALELVRLACLTYGADDRTRVPRAREMLAARPEFAQSSVHVMAMLGDDAGVRAAVARDPARASAIGGPFGWEPLLYLAYSRLEVDGGDALTTARVLLDAGADPNAGFLWDGNLPPFTALTAAFGCGEGGQAPHPRALELARVLLAAGADPNDGQTIYNRGLGNMRLADDVDWLELLYEFGFGAPSAGPSSWYRHFGAMLDAPADLVAEVLHFSAQTGLVERMRLVLAHGADPNRRGLHPAFGASTPYQAAVANGNGAIVEMLAAAGADTSGVDDVVRLVGALLSGAESARGTEAALVARVREVHPDLIRRAAELGKRDAISLLVDLGFDVNFRARTTALHEAALHDDRATVEALLGLGADPTIIDAEHQSPPAGWAAFAGHDELAAHLEAVAAERSGL